MAAHILVAEDNSDINDVMRDVLESEGYRVTTTPNGRDALAAFERETPDLIVSDVMMPHMDGFTLLERVRDHPSGAAVPFLFLSARTEPVATTKARALGADDFLYKPFNADDLLLAVRTRLARREVVVRFDTHAAHLQTVSMLANVVEARDRYTRGHVERVKNYALQLAKALNWNTQALAVLEFGALLHDLGKILVPRTVLNKPGRLLPAEMELMRRHPEDGAKMLEGVDHLRPAIPYVLYHHENWNGGGYPRGLAGETIPLEGRLLAVVDAYDAMTSERPYRVALTEAQACTEIERQAGKQFDPAMAAAFIKLRGLSR